jgi:predicted DNA-binding protein
MPYYEGIEKACNFSLRMSLELRNKIQEIAEQEHITPAYFVRNAVERAIREEELRKERTLNKEKNDKPLP